jgi:exodeoxyribonuclease-3
VNSLKVRLPRVLELLERHAPDVVCLQETKCAADAFPAGELERAGYAAAHHSAGRWAGVAILARSDLELTDARAGLPGEPASEEARWIEARIGDLRLASVYVPNGRAVDNPEFPRKLAFLEAIADRVSSEGEAWCLCGDFNVTREDRDVYDPSVFVGSTHVTADERSRFERILSAGNLRDAYRELHPAEVGFTWWDYRAGHFHRRLGLRIDYALVSREVAAGLNACGIDRDFRKGQKPSDHAPLVTEGFFANA